jgi:hypothetical protein
MQVHVDNLVPGVRYRIHEDGEEDTLGIFVGFNSSHVPVFNQLNISGPDGSRVKVNPTLQLRYPSDDYTFYKSAKTIKEENTRNSLKLALDGIVPGLGNEKFGGRRKQTRRRRV